MKPSDAYMRSELTFISSHIALSPGRRQYIIWTNAGTLLTGPLGTNMNETLIEIYIFSFNKKQLKFSSNTEAVVLCNFICEMDNSYRLQFNN